MDNHAWLMEGTEDGITLAIKPNGITCTLSKFLPQYISKNLSFFADGFLTKNKLTREDGKVYWVTEVTISVVCIMVQNIEIGSVGESKWLYRPSVNICVRRGADTCVRLFFQLTSGASTLEDAALSRRR